MAAAKALTQQELAQILTHISTLRHSARDRAIFLFGVLAGLRVGELAGLTYGDVIARDGITIKNEIYLASHRVKYGHARKIFLNSRLRDELASYIATRKWHSAEQPLFCTQRNSLTGFSVTALTQHMRNLFIAAGVQGASSHSMRKTFLTSLASQGVSVFVLAELAGHKNIATTQRYITVNEEMKRKAVELV